MIAPAAISKDDPAGRQVGEKAASKHEIDAAILDFESRARSLQMHLAAGGYHDGEPNGIWDEPWQRALADYKTALPG